MRAWHQWRGAVARSARMTSAIGVTYSSGAGRRVRVFATVFPTNDESASLIEKEDRDDRDASHLVCGKCSSPISDTRDLVFFRWRGGIHMACMTQASLQHMRTRVHWNNDENSWKKHKLHCLKCDHAVGSIARVYNSDKILFSAREAAIQMPEHQSPMISLSGYPSSMLGFTMWSELLLMLESQPNLKAQLQIRRVDNIRNFSVAKKEINTQLLLASDLKSLLDVVDKHMMVMNHVNVMTALHRASVLLASQNKSTPPVSTRQFAVRSEAPEDDLMDLSVHALVDPKKQKAERKALNKRLWKLVDSVEGLMNFGISAIRSALQLTTLATALWRLNIGRPSILRPMCKQMLKLIHDQEPGLNVHRASIIASAAAHLSSKDIRQEPWMREVLFAAADVVLKDAFAFQDKTALHDVVLPLARSLALTGHFHEAFNQRLFEVINSGLYEALSPSEKSFTNRAIKSWQSRIYQIHLDNQIAERPADVLLQGGDRLNAYRATFESSEKQEKNTLFRTRHAVASALESMELHPLALHTVGKFGYVVDIALQQQKIAIEINDADAYLAHDPRLEDHLVGDSFNDGNIKQQFHTTLPFADLKARHLEHLGWIVVQLHADEFMEIDDQEKRVEYLSMLIEIATYSRAEALQEEEDSKRPSQRQK